jgi:hypothetical protein
VPEVTLHIGPVDANAVGDWVANRQQLIDASRTSLRVSANPDALDLLDVILGLWHAELGRCGDTFDWRYDLDADVLLLIGRYWASLGRLTPEERMEMGVPPTPPHAEVVTEAVARGMVDALRRVGPKGDEVLAQLGL